MSGHSSSANLVSKPIDVTPENIGVLYRQHHSWLHNWLKGKLGCPHNAADLAQDTFCRLINVANNAANLSEIKELRAFLTTTATRIIIDNARRKKVEQHYLQNYHYYNGDENLYPCAESLAVITETLTALVKMLEVLTPKCQQAFILNRLHGLKHAEIALKLNVSPSMIKKYMAQAMVHCYQLQYDVSS